MRRAIAIMMSLLLAVALFPAVAFAQDQPASHKSEAASDATGEATFYGTVGVAHNLAPLSSDEDLNRENWLDVIYETPSTPKASEQRTDSALGTRSFDAGHSSRLARDELADGESGPSASSARRLPCGTPFLENPPFDFAQRFDSTVQARSFEDEVYDPQYQVGDVKPDFYSEARRGADSFSIECVATGDDFTLWVDQENRLLTLDQLEELAASLPGIVAGVVDYFGDWRGEIDYNNTARFSLDVDNDGKVAFVVYPFDDNNAAAGFFNQQDLYDKELVEWATGNEMDLLHINTANRIGADGKLFYEQSTALIVLAHEFQHLVACALSDMNGQPWLSETFAQAASYLLGLEDSSSVIGLTAAIENLGFIPPFIYEGNYVSEKYVHSNYSTWFLFGVYLINQTQGYLDETSGTSFFKTFFVEGNTAENDGAPITKENLIAVLERIGYLGEGGGCAVKSFDEMVMNFTRALIARERVGVHSLTNNAEDTTHNPSWLKTFSLSFIFLPSFASSIPGGGAAAVFDLPEDLFTVKNENAQDLTFSAVDSPFDLSSAVWFASDSLEYEEGDLVQFNYSGGDAQIVYAPIFTDGTYGQWTKYLGPFPHILGVKGFTLAAQCDRGSTKTFPTGEFIVYPRKPDPAGPPSSDPDPLTPSLPQPDSADPPAAPQPSSRAHVLAATGDKGEGYWCAAALLAFGGAIGSFCASRVGKKRREL